MRARALTRAGRRLALTALLPVVVAAAGGAAAMGGNSVDGPPAVTAVNAVMDYRLNWMRDSLRFDGCSVHRALGEPADFPAGLEKAFIPFLSATAQPCAARPGPADERWPLYARLDSLRLGETEGHVYVRVFRGEQDHREDYTLTADPGGPGWAVAEVRLWGASRTYPAPRAPR